MREDLELLGERARHLLAARVDRGDAAVDALEVRVCLPHRALERVLQRGNRTAKRVARHKLEPSPLSCASWPGGILIIPITCVARLARGSVLSEKKREYVEASLVMGEKDSYIALRQILPNIVSPLIVNATVRLGFVILIIAALSFLGLGIQPPVASWGNMLSNAQDLVWSSPELATWPGLFIFVTVIAFNFLGDGLQDALDPRAGD